MRLLRKRFITHNAMRHVLVVRNLAVRRHDALEIAVTNCAQQLATGDDEFPLQDPARNAALQSKVLRELRLAHTRLVESPATALELAPRRDRHVAHLAVAELRKLLVLVALRRRDEHRARIDVRRRIAIDHEPIATVLKHKLKIEQIVALNDKPSRRSR
jgi:hypothetical protein